MAKYKRRNYFINKSFQTEFILKFCTLVAIGCVVFGIVLYASSSRTLTTSFENSRLVVKSTAAIGRAYSRPAIGNSSEYYSAFHDASARRAYV